LFYTGDVSQQSGFAENFPGLEFIFVVLLEGLDRNLYFLFDALWVVNLRIFCLIVM